MTDVFGQKSLVIHGSLDTSSRQRRPLGEDIFHRKPNVTTLITN